VSGIRKFFTSAAGKVAFGAGLGELEEFEVVKLKMIVRVIRKNYLSLRHE
jgi:hypothetical protein